MRAKFEYEGMYCGNRGLVVCMRVETGGVPRFENLVIPYALAGDDGLHQAANFVAAVYKDLQAPPWADDELPFDTDAED